MSKTMSGAQQAQLTEAMQQQSNIQKNIENASKVHELSNEKSNANAVNQNGSNSQTFKGEQKKNEKDSSENQNEEHKPSKPHYAHVGTIIDISR